VARIRSADGTPVGSGFLLAPGTVVTCAHVVAQALRTDARADSAPTSRVTVEFPLQRGSVAYEASVSAWQPVAADGTGDIALLRLPEDTAAPVPLAGAGDVWDHRFRILAFPATAEHGAWIGGRLLGAGTTDALGAGVPGPGATPQGSGAGDGSEPEPFAPGGRVGGGEGVHPAECIRPARGVRA
jgi:hypothetical protein